MNRQMRRAERKTKVKQGQDLPNSNSNSIVFEQKLPVSEAELMSLSEAELSSLAMEMSQNQNQTEEMGEKKPNKRKSRQNQVTGGIESSDKAPKEPRQAYAKDIKDLTALYENLGALIALRDPLTGLIVIKSAEERATELINVAKHHKKMLEVLRRIAKGGDYGACIMGHLSMIMAILAVHGRMPIQYAIPTLQRLEIDPMEIIAQQQEARNGHENVTAL